MRTRILGAFAALAVLSSFAAPESALAKSLYMTVRRDFSPKEQPAIEINYMNDTPITFRLYRPNDMRQFISSQIDLRRAWRKPKVEANPAKFLFKGINETKLGADWVRMTLSESLRKGLKSEYGGSEAQKNASPLTEGPEKLISGPDAFKLVTEFTVYPETEDKNKAFDVPGFDWWFSGYGGRLKTREVTFPAQEPGFYLVQVVQGMLEGQVVLVVNDLVAELQQTDGMGLVRVADRQGAPVSGVSVGVRNLQGKWVADASTDGNGVTEVKSKDGELIVALNDKKRGTAIIDSEFYSATAVFPDLFLYTDRPMYKSNDKVRFRGILRQQSSGWARLLQPFTSPARSVVVSLVDADGAEVGEERSFPLTEYGTFSGEFALGGDPKSGVYRVTARLAEASHVGELRVKEYVKPVFYVKVDSDQETAKAGGEISAQVKVARYAGGVPAGAKLRADLYRVRMESPQWIEDAGMGESGSTTTYFWDQSQAPSVSTPVPVAKLEDLHPDAAGIARIKMDIPSDLPGDPNYDYKFVLKVFAEDADGNNAVGSRTFLDLKSEVVAQARMSGVLAEAGAPAKLVIRSVTASGKPYADSAGTLEWWHRPYRAEPRKLSEQELKTGPKGRIEVAVPTQAVGEVTARITLKDKKGNPSRTEASILVSGKNPAEGVIAVGDLQLLAPEPELKAGTQSRTLVLLPEKWGEKGTNQGTLHVTVAGRRIFEHRSMKVSGVAAWIDQPIKAEYGTGVYLIVSYADASRGWVERRASYRIPPNDKALKVKLGFAEETAVPGSDQSVDVLVTDPDGKPAQAELSLSVVDRALLDIQPEIRPQLLEFFYPMERLNVMSFFSTEFQSYGYGESLAKLYKANYWFAATKADEDRLKEEDTAFWSGAIRTDAQGKAHVTFRLPANQTIWNVSAVAADKSGRFGEGKGEFDARMPFTMLVGYPNFLREKDTAVVRVTLANNKGSGTQKVEYRLQGDSSLKFEKPFEMKSELKSKEEAYQQAPMQLVSRTPKGVSDLTSALQFGSVSSTFAHTLRQAPNGSVAPEYLAMQPGDRFEFKLEPYQKLQKASLLVSAGLSGAVFPALQWMLTYPYGCVEQLTSTTVPNLVIKGLLGGAGLDDEKLGKANADLMKKAESFAEAGLKKLKAYQKKDGSFGWFTASEESDLSMTLFVLATLASTEEKELLKELDLMRALSWLRSHELPDQRSTQAILVSYVEARFAHLDYGWVSKSRLEPRLKLQAEYALSSGTVVDQALVALAVKYSGIRIDRDLGTLSDRLVARLKSELGDYLRNREAITPDQWTPARHGWEAYPGRTASGLAMIGRALHEYGALDQKLTRGLSRELIRLFNGAHFGSTYETSQTLIHSAWLIQAELADRKTSPAPAFTVNGAAAPQGAVKSTASLSGWEVEIGPSAFKAGSNEIRLQGLGSSLDAKVRVLRETPFENARSVQGAWSLYREYFRVDEKTGEKKPFNPANDTLRVGDLVYVSIALGRIGEKAPWWSSRYYVLTDEIPAGMSVIEEDQSYEASPFNLAIRTARYKVRELALDRVRWYFDFSRGWMNPGDRLGYLMRASYAGKFMGGVARMEDFYDETAFSQTGAAQFRVEPKAR